MDEIQQHYNLIEEKDRLDAGLGLLEKERTRQIISRYLGGEKLKILDVGGAAGAYAFWLAGQGHEVHLSDVIPKHITQARRINHDAKCKLASAETGDARNLGSYGEENIDAILLLGPLYHLVEKQERLTALKECFRVLKKEGKLFAAGINRYASLYDGLSRELIDDPYFAEILRQDLETGQHRNPRNHPDYFTTTIFQFPAEMEAEIQEAGFSSVKCLPVEGPMWMIRNFEERWQNENKRSQVLELLLLLEKDERMLLLTHHYIAVAEK